MTTLSDYQQAILDEMGITRWRTRRDEDIQPTASADHANQPPMGTSPLQRVKVPDVCPSVSANAAEKLAAIKHSLISPAKEDARVSGNSRTEAGAPPSNAPTYISALRYEGIDALVAAVDKLGLPGKQMTWHRAPTIQVSGSLIQSPPLDEVLQSPAKKRQLWEALKRAAASL